jgi:glycosyltransferase involved in cell wall biosynthesis
MGGATRHLTSFLPALSEAASGIACDVLVRESFPAGSYANLAFQRVPDRFASSGLWRLYFESFGINRLIKNLGIDVVVSLANLGPICPAIPHIIFQRNALLFSPGHMALFDVRQMVRFRIQRSLALAAMRRASQIVTPSQSMAALIREHYPEFPANRFTVIPHAFDPSVYTEPLSPPTRALLDRPGRKLLYPALAGPHKGMDELLQIVSALPKFPQAVLYLTGGDEGGELMGHIRENAAALGVGDRVVFLGRVCQHQMGALYRSCDLLLYSSLIESFGFALLEALAFGLPIVALDTPVNRELCGAGALYFPSDNPSAGAQAVLRAFDPPVMAQLKDDGRRQFQYHDRSWSNYVKILLSLICKTQR